VYTDVADLDGLREQAAITVSLGFSGKAAIHPSQIPVIHAAFSPTEKEVAKAARVVKAAQEAAERGLGVISVDGKMVDAPVAEKARALLRDFRGEV